MNFTNVFYRSSYPVEQLSVTAFGSPEAATGGVLLKKLFLKISQYSQENTCFKADLYQKETPTKVFCCEYCEIFKNTFSEEHLQTAASGSLLELLRNHGLLNSVFSKSWRDSFHANALFQYPLNTSEKQMFSEVFRGYKNTKWVTRFFYKKRFFSSQPQCCLTFSWIQLLITHNHHHAETYFIFSIFVTMSCSSSIYVVSTRSVSGFHPQFAYD